MKNYFKKLLEENILNEKRDMNTIIKKYISVFVEGRIKAKYEMLRDYPDLRDWINTEYDIDVSDFKNDEKKKFEKINKEAEKFIHSDRISEEDIERLLKLVDAEYTIK